MIMKQDDGGDDVGDNDEDDGGIMIMAQLQAKVSSYS